MNISYINIIRCKILQGTRTLLLFFGSLEITDFGLTKAFFRLETRFTSFFFLWIWWCLLTMFNNHRHKFIILIETSLKNYLSRFGGEFSRRIKFHYIKLLTYTFHCTHTNNLQYEIALKSEKKNSSCQNCGKQENL